VKTETFMLEETPVHLTYWEKKLVEKFRECLEKSRLGQSAVTRSFSCPTRVDSDDQIEISVSARLISEVASTSETERRVEARKAGLDPVTQAAKTAND
jgi:hypothetical protein